MGYLFFTGNKKVFSRVQSGQNDQKNMEKVKKQQRVKWLNSSYLIKVVIFVAISFFIMKCVQNLPDSDAIKGFDPYEILEIDASANEQQIRKAFKKMSLKLHPDKNPDDPQAAQKFILLTKAYECLTDEQMKEVCAKYGNPDGQKSFHVGIALPSFLLKKENRAGFLAIIFLILLVIIPIIVISALDSIGKFDTYGVLNANRQLFEAYLNENFIPRNCPKVLAQS